MTHTHNLRQRGVACPGVRPSPEAMSSLEVDSQQLLRADNAVRAQKGVCLKVSKKAATGFIAAGTVAAFLIGLAIGFGCVQTRAVSMLRATHSEAHTAPDTGASKRLQWRL